jgi:hypothetical protein
MLAALREMVLATATGGFAAGTAGYFVLHDVWSRARAHGDLANSYTMQLQRLRGVRAPEPSGVRAMPLGDVGHTTELARIAISLTPLPPSSLLITAIADRTHPRRR